MKEKFEKLYEDINKCQTKVAIWGCGLLGTTNLVYVANVGYFCTGIEINVKRVEQLTNGDFDLKSDREVLSRHELPEVRDRIHVTTDWQKVLGEEYGIHMICIPTEQNGQPFHLPLQDVVKKIAQRSTKSPMLLIIESTIVPAWIQEYVVDMLATQGFVQGEDYLLGTAPRRDLFGDATFSLRNSSRVIGGEAETTLPLLQSFYGSYCEHLDTSESPEHAMLSKIVENLFRYQSITLANQIMMSLPTFDAKHVLELAATKWNMELYHPSLGIGGYCVPLAPRYLLNEVEYHGTRMPELIHASINYNADYVQEMFQTLRPLLHGKSRVALLGISYIPNIKVAVGSIAKEWANLLQRQGMEVYVHDPFMTHEELVTAVPDSLILCDLEDISICDTVIIFTDHQDYRDLSSIEPHLQYGTLIIDNFGTLGALEKHSNYLYYEMGTLLQSNGKEEWNEHQNPFARVM